MASIAAANFKLSVLNPGGRDLEQYFDRGADVSARAHPPINFHAFAACTLGAFHRDVKRAIVEKTPVLLLLRGDFKASESALVACKKAGRIVVVSLKETGLHQIAQQLGNAAKFSRFSKVIAQADGCIATTPEAAEIYRRLR